MKEKLAALSAEIASYSDASKEGADLFQKKFLSRKNGAVPQLFLALKALPPDQRKAMGEGVNTLKELALRTYERLTAQSQGAPTQEQDPTLPPAPGVLGTYHPLSTISAQIVSIFTNIGFSLVEGSVIEDDWHNFEGLGFPHNHPAREMQDTFFLDEEKKHLLRTHTTSVQMRQLEKKQLPLRQITVGSTFRNEPISARTHCTFHQVDGYYIDESVSFAELKTVLQHFVRQFFGSKTRMRLRPSYFPFTEPSAELDISCTLCADGCRVCKHSGWLEIGGAGMIDPQVLANAGLDPEQQSGYAFGIGIERLVMLKYQIEDIRFFFENNLGFLAQFPEQVGTLSPL